MSLKRSGRILAETGTILLALGMALLVWVVAVREENPTITNLYSQQIPLRVIPPAAGLVLLDENSLPDTVQVRLRGSQSSWQNLLPSKFVATVDLSTLNAGANTAPVRVSLEDRAITIIEVLPPAIAIELDRTASQDFPITVRLLGAPPLGYFNRPPLTEPLTVTVTGPATLVEAVTHVATALSLENNRETVERILPLTARTEQNVQLDQLSLRPSQVVVTVPIEQRFGYRDVSVTAVVTGQPASGYWISDINVAPATLTLRGLPNSLTDTFSLVETAPIDISGRTESLSQDVPLNLPAGFTLLSADGSPNTNPQVQVDISIAALMGGQTIQRPVEVRGVPQNYNWNTTPDTVQLILSGPLPILQNLSETDVQAVLNLFDLSPGVYRLQPTIIKPQAITITSLIPETVEVTLTSALNTPTPPSSNPVTSTFSSPISSTLLLTTSLNITPSLSLTATQESD